METNKKIDIIVSSLISLASFCFIIVLCVIINITTSGSDFFSPIYRFDSYYYNYIVLYGYNCSGIYWSYNPTVFGMYNGMSVWPFFPLLPLCVKILNILTFNRVSIILLALIFSSVCMGVMFYFIIQFFRLKKVSINYFILSVLFIFNTFYIFYFNFYTEALFMMLVSIFLVLSEKKYYFASGFVLALISATRVTGIIFVFYLFYKIYLEIEVDSKMNIFFKKILKIIKSPYYFSSISISLLGLAFFIIYLSKCWDLSPLAFIDAQLGWGKENKFFVIHIINGFKNLSHFSSSIFTILSIVFCLYLIMKEKKYFVPILMLLYIIFISTSSIASVDRYIWGVLLLSIELYTILMRRYDTKNAGNYNFFVVLPIYLVVVIILTTTLIVTISFCFGINFVY